MPVIRRICPACEGVGVFPKWATPFKKVLPSDDCYCRFCFGTGVLNHGRKPRDIDDRNIGFGHGLLVIMRAMQTERLERLKMDQ